MAMANGGERVAWLLLVILVVLPVRAARSLEPTVCPALEQVVQVEVHFDPARPFIDDSHSRAWIQEQARVLNHPIGLTSSRLAHTVKGQFEVRSTTDRGVRCIYLRVVTLTLGYPNTKVYIDNAYRPGSCEYQAIYRHELEHVRILNGYQERFLPLWHSRLRAFVYPYEIRPVASANPPQAQQSILTALEQAVGKEIQQLDKSQRAAQAAIDTVQNYAKVRASCQHW
ncbi:MAG: hypothetical protein HQL87_03705 [Magnetococcales bacterium]|nr:hypothetical protein [Magnetococcales bacterium]